jgi:hypothetical protein
MGDVVGQDPPAWDFSMEMDGIGTVGYTLISQNAGRVTLYRGEADHEKIAYDARTQWMEITPGVYDSRQDLYLMETDGSGVRCLTCGIDSINQREQDILDQRALDGDDRPGFFFGQPEWHPDAIHLIFQVENLNAQHNFASFVSFGQDNELWILNTQTLEAEPILLHTLPGNAYLHPRFSDSGETLIFSARNAGGSYGNIWDHWYIGVADFDVTAAPENMLSNIRFIQPGGRGFYETTGFLEDSETEISYSFTKYEDGQVRPYTDGGYISDIQGTHHTEVSRVPERWDEKPRYSPSGENIVIMSNRLQTDWVPEDLAVNMFTELFIGPPGTELLQLTDFASLERYDGRLLLVTDHEWSRDGRRLAVQVQPQGPGIQNAEVWIIDLPQAY